MYLTAEKGKILKNAEGGLTFIFHVLSESRIGFVSFWVFLDTEACQFHKTLFLSKARQRNYA